ncbi:hypothetical protein NEUTE2DRAFT_74987, partial [Neurospora tetrasperma FGSC 2509]
INSGTRRVENSVYNPLVEISYNINNYIILEVIINAVRDKNKEVVIIKIRF